MREECCGQVGPAVGPLAGGEALHVLNRAAPSIYRGGLGQEGLGEGTLLADLLAAAAAVLDTTGLGGGVRLSSCQCARAVTRAQ